MSDACVADAKVLHTATLRELHLIKTEAGLQESRVISLKVVDLKRLVDGGVICHLTREQRSVYRTSQGEQPDRTPPREITDQCTWDHVGTSADSESE